MIHLSLGTTLSSDYELLCPILAKLIRGNQMVVAAHSNRDAYTVPACLMGVLGVSADPQMSGYQYAVQDAAGPGAGPDYCIVQTRADQSHRPGL